MNLPHALFSKTCVAGLALGALGACTGKSTSVNPAASERPTVLGTDSSQTLPQELEPIWANNNGVSYGGDSTKVPNSAEQSLQKMRDTSYIQFQKGGTAIRYHRLVDHSNPEELCYVESELRYTVAENQITLALPPSESQAMRLENRCNEGHRLLFASLEEQIHADVFPFGAPPESKMSFERSRDTLELKVFADATNSYDFSLMNWLRVEQVGQMVE